MKSFFTNLKQRYNIRDYKISLVFLVTLISLVGILMVRSARPDLMNRQIMGVCLGLIVMFIISFIDYKWILNLYWPLYALNIVMLLAVLLFGTRVNGARRWLNLGFTQFQPSDLTKILMILFFAKFLMERESRKSPLTERARQAKRRPVATCGKLIQDRLCLSISAPFSLTRKGNCKSIPASATPNI